MLEILESDSVVAEAPAVQARAGRGRVRVVLVGCGAIAEQMHLPVLAGHEGAGVTACSGVRGEGFSSESRRIVTSS